MLVDFTMATSIPDDKNKHKMNEHAVFKGLPYFISTGILRGKCKLIIFVNYHLRNLNER